MSVMIAAFMRGVTRLNDVIGRWVALLIFAMFAFLLLEVGFRYLFNSPTVWTNELTQMLFGVYAVMSGESVVQMFVAGILPGLLGAMGLAAMCYYLARKNDFPSEGRFRVSQLWLAFKDAIWA